MQYVYYLKLVESVFVLFVRHTFLVEVSNGVLHSVHPLNKMFQPVHNTPNILKVFCCMAGESETLTAGCRRAIFRAPAPVEQACDQAQPEAPAIVWCKHQQLPVVTCQSCRSWRVAWQRVACA